MYSVQLRNKGYPRICMEGLRKTMPRHLRFKLGILCASIAYPVPRVTRFLGREKCSFRQIIVFNRHWLCGLCVDYGEGRRGGGQVQRLSERAAALPGAPAQLKHAASPSVQGRPSSVACVKCLCVIWSCVRVDVAQLNHLRSSRFTQ
jgi:hypothetical protein